MATSLTKFARNARKEATTVITARLPNSRHERFKKYCDELGLSINEAINLLIEIELSELEKEQKNNIQKPKYDESKVNTKVIQAKMIDSVKNDSGETVKSNSPKNKKFPIRPFVVNDKLPCPICDKWMHHSNFAKHAKRQHQTTTEAIFTEHRDKAEEMIKSENQKSAD